MTRKMTVTEVFDKVEWEGGVIATINWGLSYKNIADKELAKLWRKAERLEPVVEVINNYLDAHYDENEVTLNG